MFWNICIYVDAVRDSGAYIHHIYCFPLNCSKWSSLTEPYEHMNK